MLINENTFKIVYYPSLCFIKVLLSAKDIIDRQC